MHEGPGSISRRPFPVGHLKLGILKSLYILIEREESAAILC